MPPSSSSFSTSPTKRNGVVRSDTNTLLSFTKMRIRKCDCHIPQPAATPAETPSTGSDQWHRVGDRGPWPGCSPTLHADTPLSASHGRLTFSLFQHSWNTFTLQVWLRPPGRERTHVHRVAARPAEERGCALHPGRGGSSHRSTGRSPRVVSGNIRTSYCIEKLFAAKSLFRVDRHV